MSPRAEERTLPFSERQGATVEREQFVAATTPPEPADEQGVAAPEPVGQPLEPQAVEPEAVEEGPLPDLSDILVAGAELPPEEAEALFAPSDEIGVDEDVQGLEVWADVLEDIAAVPGSSRAIKELARRVRAAAVAEQETDEPSLGEELAAEFGA